MQWEALGGRTPPLVPVLTLAICCGCAGVGGGPRTGKSFSPGSAPEIEQIVPILGSVAGGTTLTITGGKLGRAVTVTVAGIEATGLVVHNEFLLTCKAPAWGGPLGWVDVVVTTETGSAAVERGFIYVDPSLPQPEVRTIIPDRGSAVGGTEVTISGENLEEVVRVTFGGTEAEVLPGKGGSDLHCTTPKQDSGEGSVDVVVTTNAGSFSVNRGFAYLAPRIAPMEVGAGPRIASLEWRTGGAGEVTISWQLNGNAEEIVLYRGASPLATLAGDSRAFSVPAEETGLFRYTLALFIEGDMVDQEDVIVDVGTVRWDPATTEVEGYYIYVNDTSADQPDPAEPAFDARTRTEIRLKELYDAGLIQGGKTYSIAVSSYVCSIVSARSEPVICQYTVTLDEPK